MTPGAPADLEYVDFPVCIDEHKDGIYRRQFPDGHFYAIEKYSGSVIEEW